MNAIAILTNQQQDRESLGRMRRSLAKRWDDADGHVAIGYFWMNQYRKDLFRAGLKTQPWLEKKAIWVQSDIEHQLQILRNLDDVQSRKYQAFARQNRALQQANTHFQFATHFCPWNSTTHLWLATSEFLMGEDQSGKRAKQATRFAGGKVDTWYRIGLFHAAADEKELAISAWQKCLTYSRQYDQLITNWARQLNIGDIEAILPKDPGVCYRFAMREQKSNDTEKAIQLAKLGIRHAHDNPKSVNNWQEHATVAKLYSLLDNEKEYMRSWQESVNTGGEPARISFANHLISKRKFKEARKQLGMCRSKDATKVLLRLNELQSAVQ